MGAAPGVQCARKVAVATVVAVVDEDPLLAGEG
jgi:hypothetical protein